MRNAHLKAAAGKLQNFIGINEKNTDKTQDNVLELFPTGETHSEKPDYTHAPELSL
ncbi:MAG: hypothetical protein ACRBDI_09325 [Alphaproteobacteria bacterium]